MNRRAIAIGAAVLVVVLLFWYLVLWSPRTKSLHDATLRRQAAEAQIAETKTRIARLKAAQKQEPLVRSQVEALRTAIPDDPALAQFILDANDAATKAGIDFISIAPSLPAAFTRPGVAAAATAPAASGAATPSAGAGPAQITLALQVRGGYFQVLDFLNRLDGLPRLVVTDQLTLTGDAGARLTAAVTGRMFLRSVPASYAPPGTVRPTTSTTAAGGATTTTVAGATTTTTGARP